MPELSRKAADTTVLIDGVAQGKASLLSVGMSINAIRGNFATFIIRDIGHGQSALQDVEVQDLFVNKDCRVLLTADGFTTLIHLGQVVAASVAFDGDGEVVTLHSRLDRHMFGDPINKIALARRFHSAPDDSGMDSYARSTFDGETRFNPITEGLPTPNCSAGLFSDPSGTSLINLFVDTMGVDQEKLSADRSSGDLGLAGAIVQYWTLTTAVNYLCWTLNHEEKHIANPDFSHLVEVFETDDFVRNEIRDIKIPAGTYLTQALDTLTIPHGYYWYVDHSVSKPRIRFGSKDKSQIEELKLQAWGETLDPRSLSQVAGIDLTMDVIDRAFNDIEAVGGYEEKEISVILRPAWDPELDPVAEPKSRDKFDRNSDEFRDDELVRQAWRKYGANESYQYKERGWWTRALDLSRVFDGDDEDIYPRRRQFYPMITRDADGTSAGKSQGTYLEYWDANSTQPSWKPVTGSNEDNPGLENGSYQLVEDEMAIYFDDQMPPPKLFDIGAELGVESLLLRITAVIRSDTRIRAQKTAPASLITEKASQVIDYGKSYAYRTVVTLPPAELSSSSVGGTVMTGKYDAKVDSRVAIGVEAGLLLEKFNSATCQGVVQIEGLDWGFENKLGHRVKSLDGRKLGFKTTADGVLLEQYPSIVAVTWNVNEQRIHLRLDGMK